MSRLSLIVFSLCVLISCLVPPWRWTGGTLPTTMIYYQPLWSALPENVSDRKVVAFDVLSLHFIGAAALGCLIHALVRKK